LQLLYFAILQFISWDRHRKHVLAPASIVGSVSSEAFQTAFGIINEALQFPQGVLLILGKGWQRIQVQQTSAPRESMLLANLANADEKAPSKNRDNPSSSTYLYILYILIIHVASFMKKQEEKHKPATLNCHLQHDV